MMSSEVSRIFGLSDAMPEEMLPLRKFPTFTDFPSSERELDPMLLLLEENY
ncbi:hypothetical protein Mapa_002595 [Marchantia paleacea]|nr:hypothetical protein Mapa_002595 [Marchantia paleacea]